MISRFHFPNGNPSTLNPYGDGNMEKFTQEFRRHKNASVNVDELGEVLKVRLASLVELASFSPLPLRCRPGDSW